MPGLYTLVATRLNGETLTADKYNADHQNHIDHLEPQYIDDLSANTSAMQNTLDPGEMGSEAAAASLAEEIRQIRAMLAEMKGTNQWYESYVNQTTQYVTPSPAANITTFWAPTGSTTLYWGFVIPARWSATSNIVWSLVRRTTSGSGTAVMSYQVDRERDGQAVANIVTTTAANFLPGDGNAHKITLTIPGAALIADDWIIVSMTRAGDNGSDNDGGNIIPVASYFTFTGIASRA